MRWMRQNASYIGLLAASFVVAVAASWTSLGRTIDNSAYDWFFRLYQPQPWRTQSAVLAIDEETLSAYGGLPGIRPPLAKALGLISGARPRAVAIDLILSDRGEPAADETLAGALRTTPNLVLSSDLLPNGGGWEDPLPGFRPPHAPVGHVHAGLDQDAVNRALPLERVAGRDRRWALSLEAFRVSRAAQILESPADLQVGSTLIPARRDDGRMMRIRYIPPGMKPVPHVSLKQLVEESSLASRFAGRVVFVGVTAQTAVRDRWMTPYSFGRVPMPGVQIHAEAFETMAQGSFLTDAPVSLEVFAALLLVVAAGFIYAAAPGWRADVLAALLLASTHATSYVFLTQGKVFSFITPVSAAWLSIVTAAAWQHLVVRRRLLKVEVDRLRYQQTMHFVTHEMRTPLTAIQGSSELIGRYAKMPEEKRKQMADLINSESKRLGRLIEIFLNVERLSAGQMELKREVFPLPALVEICVARVRPLAERKQIEIAVEPLPEESLTGDRELMEYAVYNLLTNAVKYSPKETRVTVSGAREGERLRLAVKDQGIGMDQKEVKQIFRKFYRTKKAEASGEAGTGIGLSIVQEIVNQHGGTIEVTSRPGEGSCFTLVLPATVMAAEKH